MVELTVEARVENLDQVMDFVNGQLEAADCSMKAQMQINVAVEELFVNIAHYAYDGRQGDVDPPAVEITFIDRGVRYDPLAKPDPDVTLAANQRQIGGLGIFMVKKSMDGMHYAYLDGQNVLRIRKNL